MNKTYEVGYQKPPKKNQFKPGQSGNRKGRPKGTGFKEIKSIVLNILGEKIEVNENGKTSTKTKLEVLYRQLFNQALKGGPQARYFLDMLEKFREEDYENRDYWNKLFSELFPKDEPINS